MQRIQTKRVRDEAKRTDGRRILIDRLWPRGVAKVSAKIDYWARAIAPTNALRQWYKHDHAKWPEFRRRYFAELDANPDGVAELRAQMDKGTNTFLFDSKEAVLNNASALKEYLGR